MRFRYCAATVMRGVGNQEVIFSLNSPLSYKSECQPPARPEGCWTVNSLRRTEKEESVSWIAEPNVCPGLFYGTSAQDGYLIRIRTPGGWLNHQQGRAIATLLEQWNSETIQVTNRANLQIRSVHTAPTVEVLQSLQQLGLAADNPNLDHLRNIMTSPTAGIDPQELIDTRPLVQALDAYIQSHPELAGLPAKFSIGVDGGGAVGIGTRSPVAWEHRYNEIQLSAVSDGENQIYFRLALGADKQLCETQVLIEPGDCVSVVAALAAVYLDYVNQAPPSQKKPRMKHLLQDWGLESYLQQVSDRLSRPLQWVGDRPNLSPTQPTHPYGHLGIHPQRQDELSPDEFSQNKFSYVGISLPLGQLTAAQLRGLVQLSESFSRSFGREHLRLTPWQTVLLPDIPNAHIPDLLQALSALGLSASTRRPDTAIVACAGKPGCAASETQTQRHAVGLAEHLNPRITLEHPVNIHLTGCPKSCAQPSPAEITLLGTTIEHQGKTVEGYHIYVGGQPLHSNSELCTVTAAEMPSLIEQLLQLYQRHCKPDESFGAFASRFSIPHFSLPIPCSAP